MPERKSREPRRNEDTLDNEFRPVDHSSRQPRRNLKQSSLLHVKVSTAVLAWRCQFSVLCPAKPPPARRAKSNFHFYARHGFKHLRSALRIPEASMRLPTTGEGVLY